MEIKQEGLFHGPNFLLPAPTVSLVLGRAGGFGGLIQSRLDRLVGCINQTIQAAGGTAELGAVDRDLLQREPALAVGDLVVRTVATLHREYAFSSELMRTVAQPQPDQVSIAYEFGDLTLGLLAGRYAVAIWAAMLGDPEAPPEALQALYDRFKKQADEIGLVIETRLLVQELRRRKIPWIRFGGDTPLLQVGQGARMRRFHNSMSDETPDMAYRLATIKPVAARLLREHGLPVPPQTLTETLDQALAAARRIGFPIVIKPINQDRGIGVKVAIANETELAAAYAGTRSYSAVQVEKYLPGFDYRFTFIRGALLGVLCTMPPILSGDGKATIRQLLDAAPVTTATFARRKVIVDDEVLRRIAERGYTPSDVLPAGERIVLRQWWRNQLDHMLENVTAVTHPENIEAASLAVRLIGLDIAGVDFITSDITRPFYETGGAFTEVNPMPALAGVQRCGMPAYRTMIEAFYPPGDDGRIPTALLLGGGDASPVLDAAERLLHREAHGLGIATLGRFAVGGRPVRRADADEAARIRAILADPRATVAIFQATPETIAGQGLAIDLCDVGVILPAGETAEPSPAAGDAARQAAILVARLARKALVLGVDEPAAAALVGSADARRIFWVAADGADDGADGGGIARAQDAVLGVEPGEGGPAIVLRDEGHVRYIAPAPGPWLGTGPDARRARQANLVAIAIALALGVDPGGVAEALNRPRP